MTTTIEIHREKLYKQVWAEHVTKLAAQYGISRETGLANLYS